jgi:hypothetical protein
MALLVIQANKKLVRSRLQQTNINWERLGGLLFLQLPEVPRRQEYEAFNIKNWTLVLRLSLPSPRVTR